MNTPKPFADWDDTRDASVVTLAHYSGIYDPTEYVGALARLTTPDGLGGTIEREGTVGVDRHYGLTLDRIEAFERIAVEELPAWTLRIYN